MNSSEAGEGLGAFNCEIARHSELWAYYAEHPHDCENKLSWIQSALTLALPRACAIDQNFSQGPARQGVAGPTSPKP
jgi:hypothetical protein